MPVCNCGRIPGESARHDEWCASLPAQTSEVRVTDPTTGGAKGSKPSQLAWAPPETLHALGEVYGFGAQKYDPTNYRKGYAWSLSLNAMYRHLLQWQAGEDLDPESGLSHLLHAAWHCLTLHYFSIHHPDKDDVRWNPSQPPTSSDSTTSPEQDSALWRQVEAGLRNEGQPSPSPTTPKVPTFQSQRTVPPFPSRDPEC